MNNYPYVAECSIHGALAVFEERGRGVLLKQGSSWVSPGTIVCENGFNYKEDFKLSGNSTMADRERLFLSLMGFDLGYGSWDSDIQGYKQLFKFAYDYIIKHKGTGE